MTAEAENGLDAVQLAKKLRPHIVIMDIGMPGLNGIEATRQIVADVPSTKVIALSMHSDRRYVTGALAAGVSGYLVKDCALDELSLTLKTAAKDTCTSARASPGSWWRAFSGQNPLRPRPRTAGRASPAASARCCN